MKERPYLTDFAAMDEYYDAQATRERPTLRSAVAAIVLKYEAGQNHDAGAYDADCETCRILSELRAALSAGKCGGE